MNFGLENWFYIFISIKALHLISASPYFTRKHGFEYINLREVEDNPIVGKVVFSLKNGSRRNTLEKYEKTTTLSRNIGLEFLFCR